MTYTSRCLVDSDIMSQSPDYAVNTLYVCGCLLLIFASCCFVLVLDPKERKQLQIGEGVSHKQHSLHTLQRAAVHNGFLQRLIVVV